MKRSALYIGLFVVVGLLVAALGISSLGGHRLFDKRIRATLHFDGSVKGLYIGAPVTFRGVPVGQVDAIGLELNSQTLVTRVPVSVSLMPKLLNDGEAGGASQALASLVDRGLRARLLQQSLVTGQVQIDLDFEPHPAPAPGQAYNPSTKTVEIPVVKGQFDDLVAQLSTIPIKDTVEDLRKTLQSINATSDTARRTMETVTVDVSKTSAAAQQFMQHTNQTIAVVGQQAALGLQSINSLSSTTEHVIVRLQPDLEATLASARQAAHAADLGFQSLADMTAPGSPVREDLQSAVRDLAQTSRSLRDVAELLERQPNALIFGRP